MKPGIILAHGYGVRSPFWAKLAPALEASGHRVTAVDLEADSPTALVERLEGLVHASTREFPVALVGHSLGGILAMLASYRLDPSMVSHVVVIASPFGSGAKSVGPVLRFLIRHRLLPPALVRPRFFSRATSRADQKLWFARAVPESPLLQETLFNTDWFPARTLAGGPRKRCLAIFSEADRIVDADATRRLASTLAAEQYVFPAERGIGHNDFAASDSVTTEVARVIVDFLSR